MRDVAHLHAGAGHLRAEADGHTLVGLHADDERVLAERRGLALREEILRRALEDDGDLGDAAAEALARAQVEGHARPAARADVEPDGGVGLGGESGFIPSSSRKPTTFSPPCQPPAYWPRAVRAEVLRQADGGQHLLLLGAQVGGVEGDRLLHRREGEELQQVVLDDVARRADAVVVAGTAADADVLGHRDLHVVDVVGVPDRLVELVGEAQRQDVLDRLLAEVVVDAEHRVGREDRLDDGVQLARRLQVAAERLLDDDAAPCAFLLVGEARAAQLLGDQRERLRRDREVERVVAHRAPLGVEVVDGLLEVSNASSSSNSPGTKRMPSASWLPDVLVERRAGVLLDGVVDDLLEVLVLPVAPGEADEREAREEAGRGWRGRRRPA